MSKKKKKLRKAIAKAMKQYGQGGGPPYSYASGDGAAAGRSGPHSGRSWSPHLGLDGFLGSASTRQFLMGLALGAGATYVLGDKDIREKILKVAIKMYADVAGGVEEMKEQVADLKAELDTEAG